MLYPGVSGHTIFVPAMMITSVRRWDVRWKSCRARPWWVFINCSKRILGGEPEREGGGRNLWYLYCVLLLIDMCIYIWARDNISINYVYREGFMDIRVWSFSWRNDRGHPKDDTPLALTYQIMRSQEWKLKLSTWLFIRTATCRFGFQLFARKTTGRTKKYPNVAALFGRGNRF